MVREKERHEKEAWRIEFQGRLDAMRVDSDDNDDDVPMDLDAPPPAGGKVGRRHGLSSAD